MWNGFLILLTIKNELEIDPSVRTTHKIVRAISKSLEERYNISQIGLSEGGNKTGYNFIGLTFQVSRISSNDEARTIAVHSSNLLLDTLNINPKMQPYLLEKPFTLNNIKISVIIMGADNEELVHPHLSALSAFDGNIYYHTNSATDPFKYASNTEETFEEAQRIVLEQEDTN